MLKRHCEHLAELKLEEAAAFGPLMQNTCLALACDYPAAEIQRDQTGLGRWVSAILQHLDGRQPHLDLPLDVQGTAFQWQVWEALRAIPYGATRSYGEIARALGKAQAARAPATRCPSSFPATGRWVGMVTSRVIVGEWSANGRCSCKKARLRQRLERVPCQT